MASGSEHNFDLPPERRRERNATSGSGDNWQHCWLIGQSVRLIQEKGAANWRQPEFERIARGCTQPYQWS